MIFASIFSIVLRHEYTADGICRGLRIQPCAHTQELLKKMNARTHAAPGKITVTAETGEDGKLRFEPIMPFRLRFWLIQDDLLFTNYTDLDLLGSKRIAVFQNRFDKNGSALLLHAEEKTDNTAVTAVLPVPGVKDHVSGNFSRVPDGSVHGISRTGHQLIVNGDTEDEGLLTNADASQSVYAARLPKAAVLGVVEIFHSENIPGEALLIDSDGHLRNPEFNVHFAARSSYWRYLLSGKVIQGWNGLVITDSDRSIFFSGPETSVLFDGTPALEFRSPERIPLREKPSRHFQLRRNADTNGNTGTAVVDKLPSASADLIHLPRQPGSDEVVSEIIVHL